MLCDRCHENEAIVSIIEVIDGKEQTVNLCKECAAKTAGRGFTVLQNGSGGFFSGLLASLLGLSDLDEDDEEEESAAGAAAGDLKKTNVVCPSCGMTYNEFLKYGNFGCPECYRTFNFLLDGYFKNIHGNDEHAGRRPAFNGETVMIPNITPEQKAATEAAAVDPNRITVTVDRDSSVGELRAALRRAVAREEYEEAARIRDMIKECEDKGNA